MDEETSFTADDNGTNDVGRTDNDHSNEEDDSSNNDSWSSYDILPSEDFSNNEHGANSENEDVDVGNEQNNFEESWADNLSQEGSDGPDGGDDEAEMDIEEAQYQQRVLETHWKVMAMTFRSQGDAYIFYNRHAKEHGFSIRTEKVKRGKGASGIIRFRRFVCSRAGRRQRKFITMEGRTRRLRPETRCECGAQMVVKLDRARGVWFVASFVDDHNHAMARPDEVPFLWSHRRIGDGARAEILAMQGAGIRKHIIVDNFISRYGSYDKCGLIRRDVYNLCCREKMKLIAKGDAETAVGIMRSRQAKDPDFFFEYELDKEGRLKCMFWCDAQSRRDYQDYGDVVVFDSTYKMNRYGMPFVPFVGVNNHRCTTVFGCAIVSDETEATYVWLLQTFMRANCQQKPKSIITDGDAAMLRAIRSVLSDVLHRICSCHIEKNMQRHLHYKSLDEFRSLLYYATSEENFEERWTAFVNKWKTDKTEEWLRRMYRKRRLWAASYLSDGFFLGMRSNQRSESLNSSLHLHLDYGMTIVDLVVHYENCIVRLRENEANDDCEANQKVPPAVTEYKDIEEHAAKVFTPANFYILQNDLKKMGELEIFETLVGIERQTFIVTWQNNHKFRYNVLYEPGNSEETLSCTCRRMVRKGLPCKHILFVLHHLKLSEIPKCCVLHRLSKDARDGLSAQRKSDLFGWGWSGPEERERYSQVSIKSAEAAHVAANDPFLFDELMKCLDGIIARKKITEEELIGRRRCALIAKQAIQAEEGATGIRDPEKVSTKGAPKKGRSKGGPDVTKNGRPKDFREKKSGPLCSLCHFAGHNKATCSLNEKYRA
ncbi:protein FAR1-RELATED SEQUENCE 5-like [Triticum aestivum]|uniref:protein FAR1-RELATED SEQUENCE 5-like n=1 Tax=Triticum aestivum TaxID=4565 RepID=UPI001D01CD14|nr:protein FAR1-RELATED SEQUENCE 5-like [Triticum aestivum]